MWLVAVVIVVVVVVVAAVVVVAFSLLLLLLLQSLVSILIGQSWHCDLLHFACFGGLAKLF